MNELIKSLAENAYNKVNHIPNVKIPKEFIDIFSRSLIEQCLEQVDKLADSMEKEGSLEQSIGASWAALAIERKFK